MAYHKPTVQDAKEQAEAKQNEVKATAKTGAEALLAEIRQGKSERLLALLDFAFKFHHYSPTNQLLIQLACMARGIDAQYSAKGRTGLKPGLDSTSKFLTLIHEYTHELLHPGGVGEGMTKQVKECQAEATAYIVARHFGVHNPFSSDYLQTWGNDEKSLMAELSIVQKTASLIIERMEQPYHCSLEAA